MVCRRIKIVNELGLHTRAAAKLVNVASQFRSDVKLGTGDELVEGKSILGLLLLAVHSGTEVVVRCDGPDEDEAMASIAELIEDGFGELDG